MISHGRAINVWEPIYLFYPNFNNFIQNPESLFKFLKRIKITICINNNDS